MKFKFSAFPSAGSVGGVFGIGPSAAAVMGMSYGSSNGPCWLNASGDGAAQLN